MYYTPRNMVLKSKKLIIVGAGEFAQIAYEYFTYDSEYEVVGFAVNKEYLPTGRLYDLPVIAVEDMRDVYPPDQYEVFVAITYVKLNRSRKKLYRYCKELGYRCASYVSSHSFFWHNAVVGDNSFIFEDNTIQHFVSIGSNVIMWSGNHIGHRTKIADDCWLTSHNVISGFCNIEAGCFLGVNCTVGDNVHIAKDVILGAGSVTVKDLSQAGGVYIGSPAKLCDKTSYEKFNVLEEEI